ncbi:unnamed protein product [Didymodactylos carnosus]|uniref:Uncharacterized protein n=1 Tax=Didymodactylos carnosus TaxID=1234261 RepID=A0A814IQZ0_9BILA|nr:unnamed protein product [Didymodactylos carnosus]CAF1026022.1 unnamed protein product [Didymodactylos carnosus]CAF3759833.1 unnamed protein product [Didymodactylos carnosus]CAF3797173.1 unnamed protein product [Didymodactylos carnosus]
MAAAKRWSLKSCDSSSPDMSIDRCHRTFRRRTVSSSSEHANTSHDEQMFMNRTKQHLPGDKWTDDFSTSDDEYQVLCSHRNASRYNLEIILNVTCTNAEQKILQQKQLSANLHQISLMVSDMQNDGSVDKFIEVAVLTVPIDNQYYSSSYLISTVDNKNIRGNTTYLPIIGNKFEDRSYRFLVKYNQDMLKSIGNLTPFRFNKENVEEINNESYGKNCDILSLYGILVCLLRKRRYATMVQASDSHNSGPAQYPVIRKYQTMITQEEYVVLYVAIMIKVNDIPYFHPTKGFLDSTKDTMQLKNPIRILLTKENVKKDGIIELKMAIMNPGASNTTQRSFLPFDTTFSHTTSHKHAHDIYQHHSPSMSSDEEFNVFKTNDPVSKQDLSDYYLACAISHNGKIDWETLSFSSKMTKRLYNPACYKVK